MRIKICGITMPEQGRAIAALGANALGFICVPQSPRYVTPAQIQAVGAELPETVARVGVFMNETIAAIGEIAKVAGLTSIQLHGNESTEDCDRLRELLPGVELIKAFRIRTIEDLDYTQIYEPHVDWLLLDAYHPTLGGGTGKTLDWQTLQTFRPKKPWLLAGGLTPQNVREALTLIQPQGIDLSSGVENQPGDKNLDLVQQLFQQVSDRIA
ncbi:phosphoribosylanthranilate isomerase [Alkalinema sp. FACHB-956]|uniref:phosphoribosylanthranilate isomerase n=1 Tax=Alkalinema sp. FACHB-956 TaxID=2692768 RepID=UPI0016842672|nr:phosphoribosylanthranilate isomerase [Alkalinema sp. FACHB-956]